LQISKWKGSQKGGSPVTLGSAVLLTVLGH
jgi:hypothetical protein